MRRGTPARGERQLPAQVPAILQPRVRPRAAVRRVAVGRVARQKDPPLGGGGVGGAGGLCGAAQPHAVAADAVAAHDAEAGQAVVSHRALHPLHAGWGHGAVLVGAAAARPARREQRPELLHQVGALRLRINDEKEARLALRQRRNVQVQRHKAAGSLLPRLAVQKGGAAVRVKSAGAGGM